MLKTIAVSKIKEVKSVSDPYGKYQTLYHKLIMENGDKIDIGKQKEQKVGWEMTYEITEEGQNEFNKAKAVAPEGFKSNNTTSGSSNGVYKKDDTVQKLIVKQSSLKAAVDYCSGGNFQPNEVLAIAREFVGWVMEDTIIGYKNFDENDKKPF
jgi:hypothetical protein